MKEVTKHINLLNKTITGFEYCTDGKVLIFFFDDDTYWLIEADVRGKEENPYLRSIRTEALSLFQKYRLRLITREEYDTEAKIDLIKLVKGVEETELAELKRLKEKYEDGNSANIRPALEA